ncbi:MAG: prepilin-type N-terminal cleavage/methylation domain-containing protein [Vicinamibacterales bacterium]|nr:prepilin-type N-terminal cleavage/methylation domain-containing protein [Vicinamibacterales bacterium]
MTGAAQGERHHPHAGFTAIELLISMAIMLVVGASALALVAPLRALFDAASATADLSQRLRAGAAVLSRDLASAGSGLVAVDEHGGFGSLLPAVLPDTLPAVGGSAAPVAFRPSTLTMLSVPPSAAQATLAAGVTGLVDPLMLSPTPFCAGALAACGFSAGTPLVVFDEMGAWDLVTVSSVNDAVRGVWHVATPRTQPYPAGAIVARIARRTYAVREDAATGALSLTRDEGGGAAQTMIDFVAGFEVELLGTPQPPLVRAVDDEGWSWTTYGPPPPPIGHGAGAWPDGENCVFARSAEAAPVPRLATLGAGHALVPLAEAELTDGPWCPDALAARRYDADLLRVRQAVITLRVQVASTMLRGPAGALFARGGTGRSRVRVPDREVRFAVTPRSLGAER